MLCLSTAYLPPVSWVARAIRADRVLIEQWETYPKQTYRNRCHLYAASGLQALTIPVKRVNGNHTLIRDIAIDNSSHWQLVHWRSIESAYRKSPYFLYYADLFRPSFEGKKENLLQFNTGILDAMAPVTGLPAHTLELTPGFEKSPAGEDLRHLIHPKKNSSGTVIKDFPRYIQPFEQQQGFLPDLSIIDLLFNLGPAAREYLRALEVPYPPPLRLTGT